MPELSEEFEVEFEFFAYSATTEWANVFRMTKGTTNNNLGDRIPAVFIRMEGSIPTLCVCMLTKGLSNTDRYSDIPIAIKSWYTLKIAQRKSDDGNFLFEIVLDGIAQKSVVNQNPEIFHNVKMFATDNLSPAFDGLVRNIRVCQQGNCFCRKDNIAKVIIRKMTQV